MANLNEDREYRNVMYDFWIRKRQLDFDRTISVTQKLNAYHNLFLEEYRYRKQKEQQRIENEKKEKELEKDIQKQVEEKLLKTTEQALDEIFKDFNTDVSIKL